MAVSGSHNGWHYDPANTRLDFYYRGTRVGHINATVLAGALAITAATTVTAGTGLTVTTGNATLPAGNVVLGTPGAFATTQGVAIVKMGGSSLSGVAPVGAITTAGAVFASDTAVMKIVAGGTANNVET